MTPSPHGQETKSDDIGRGHENGDGVDGNIEGGRCDGNGGKGDGDNGNSKRNAPQRSLTFNDPLEAPSELEVGRYKRRGKEDRRPSAADLIQVACEVDQLTTALQVHIRPTIYYDFIDLSI